MTTFKKFAITTFHVTGLPGPQHALMCLCQRAILSGNAPVQLIVGCVGLAVYITPPACIPRSEFGGRAGVLTYSGRNGASASRVLGVIDEMVLRLLEFQIRDDISVE
jgi:hypothetical protein